MYTLLVLIHKFDVVATFVLPSTANRPFLQFYLARNMCNWLLSVNTQSSDSDP